MSLVKVEPESLILSALKKAEEGEAVILRLYNTVPQTIHTEFEVALNNSEEWRFCEGNIAP